MKAVELAEAPIDCWRNIAITLVDPHQGTNKSSGLGLP